LSELLLKSVGDGSQIGTYELKSAPQMSKKLQLVLPKYDRAFTKPNVSLWLGAEVLI
jgi:hypothetical protein